MTLDKGNLLRQLFEIECETEKLILVFATILVLGLFFSNHYPTMIPQ